MILLGNNNKKKGLTLLTQSITKSFSFSSTVTFDLDYILESLKEMFNSTFLVTL